MSDTWVKVAVVSILIKEGHSEDEDELARRAHRLVEETLEEALVDVRLGDDVKRIVVA